MFQLWVCKTDLFALVHTQSGFYCVSTAKYHDADQLGNLTQPYYTDTRPTSSACPYMGNAS